MQQAISKAIEGGYKRGSMIKLRGECNIGIYDHALLDPLFWQALENAMNWKEETVSYSIKSKQYTIVNSPNIVKRGAHTITRRRWKKNAKPWLSHQHDFIDHLASGKDADSYFQRLLKDNK